MCPLSDASVLIEKGEGAIQSPLNLLDRLGVKYTSIE